MAAIQSKGYTDPLSAYNALVGAQPVDYLSQLDQIRQQQNDYMQNMFSQQNTLVQQSSAAQQQAIRDNIAAIKKAYDAQKQNIYDTQKQSNSAAYGAYQKAINPYGTTAESLAMAGQTGSGMSDYLQSQAYGQLRNDISGYNRWANTEIQDLEALKAQAEADGNMALAELYGAELDKKLSLMQSQMQYQMSAYDAMLQDAATKYEMQNSGSRSSGGGSGSDDIETTETSPNIGIQNKFSYFGYDKNRNPVYKRYLINGKYVPAEQVEAGILSGKYIFDPNTGIVSEKPNYEDIKKQGPASYYGPESKYYGGLLK
jgi:hypothetical protein